MDSEILSPQFPASKAIEDSGGGAQYYFSTVHGVAVTRESQLAGLHVLPDHPTGLTPQSQAPALHRL